MQRFKLVRVLFRKEKLINIDSQKNKYIIRYVKAFGAYVYIFEFKPVYFKIS